MNDSAIEDRLVTCFAAVFPHLSRARIPSAATATIEEWDSLAGVTLIALIQEEFGVEIPPEDFERLTSFALILDLVTRQIQTR